MIPGFFSAAICFIGFLLGHVLLFQLFTVRQRFRAMAILWFLLLAAYVPLYFFFQSGLPSTWVSSFELSTFEGVLYFLSGILTYLLVFLIYLCLYFTDHSLTVAFAIEFEKRGRMTREELKKRFPYALVLSLRFQDMLENGYVLKDEGAFKLARKGRVMVFLLGGLKRFLKLEPGG